jgi:hypothetical protein
MTSFTTKKAVEVDDALESDGGAKLRYGSATLLIRNISVSLEDLTYWRIM